jgi:hypothetical protein
VSEGVAEVAVVVAAMGLASTGEDPAAEDVGAGRTAEATVAVADGAAGASVANAMSADMGRLTDTATNVVVEVAAAAGITSSWASCSCSCFSSVEHGVNTAEDGGTRTEGSNVWTLSALSPETAEGCASSDTDNNETGEVNVRAVQLSVTVAGSTSIVSDDEVGP